MNDTIYRQDAIDAIHGAIIDFFDICDDDEESPMAYKDELLLEINKAISGRIKQLPSVQPEQRWIPCSERMPEDYEEVLVWFEYFRYGDYNRLYQTHGIGDYSSKYDSWMINHESGWNK